MALVSHSGNPDDRDPRLHSPARRSMKEAIAMTRRKTKKLETQATSSSIVFQFLPIIGALPVRVLGCSPLFLINQWLLASPAPSALVQLSA
jgi:hypothetical protein